MVKWTTEKKKFISDNHEKLSFYELIKKFNENFNEDISKSAMRGQVQRIKEKSTFEKVIECDRRHKNYDINLEDVISKEKRKRKFKKFIRNKKLKDFSELEEGKVYNIEYAAREKNGDGVLRNATFIGMDEYKLYFRSKIGCIETFLRHRNLIQVYEVKSREEVCKNVNFIDEPL